MLESLVITLREGLEAALALGIVIVFLRRTGREALMRWAWAGLAAAVVASLAGAVLLSRIAYDPEKTEGFLMLLAAAMVLSMVIWMARHGRNMKGDIESRLARMGEGTGPGPAAALFAVSFLLVFREGVETVLMLAAVSLTSEGVGEFIGGVIGLVLAVGFGVAFVKGTVRVNLSRFFRITGAVLMVFAAQLVLGGVHELAEGGVIPIGRTAMRLIGPVVKAEGLFLAALLAIPLFAFLLPSGGGAQEAAEAPAESGSGPERRRRLARARAEKTWRALATAVGLVAIVSLTASWAFSRGPRVVDPPRLLETASGEVHLPVAGLDDGHLHRFGVALGGTVVRFFTMKGEGGRLVTAFDACEVCGGGGYVENKGRLVCIVCAADIVPSTVGVGGGCNPIPLASRVEGVELLVSVADLEKMAGTFAEAPPASPPSR